MWWDQPRYNLRIAFLLAGKPPHPHGRERGQGSTLQLGTWIPAPPLKAPNSRGSTTSHLPRGETMTRMSYFKATARLHIQTLIHLHSTELLPTSHGRDGAAAARGSWVSTHRSLPLSPRPEVRREHITIFRCACHIEKH